MIAWLMVFLSPQAFVLADAPLDRLLVSLLEQDGFQIAASPQEADVILWASGPMPEGYEAEILALNDAASFPRPMPAAILLTQARKQARQGQLRWARKGAVGPVRLDIERQTLQSAKGDEAALTDREMALLLSLLRADGGVVEREVLLRNVFGYSEQADTHTLETHVYRLRQKLASLDPACADALRAQDGGYKLGPMPPP